MKKVLIIFGTRPEAIKLAPVIRQIKAHNSKFRVSVCVTAQHRAMLDQILNLFDIRPDYDLNIMAADQDLFEITIRSLHGLKRVMKNGRPNLVIVQGDTTTSFAGALASYYMRIPVAHIEAGLRTYNKYNPFPEEKNRHLTGVLADYHFAPTEWAKSNLLKENIPAERIWVTGNTVIDALITVVNGLKSVVREKEMNKYFREKWNLTLPFYPKAGTGPDSPKLILVTAHRRENFGEGLRGICLALKEIAENNPNLVVIYPVHLNPNVRCSVYKILGFKQTSPKNLFLIDPLGYESFVYLLSKAYLILTDSGGIQEEAPSLGKPVLVMRNTTERPEGVEAGTVRLVGINKDGIVKETQRLLENKKHYEKMSKAANPYGDGKAAQRIVNILLGNLR